MKKSRISIVLLLLALSLCLFLFYDYFKLHFLKNAVETSNSSISVLQSKKYMRFVKLVDVKDQTQSKANIEAWAERVEPSNQFIPGDNLYIVIVSDVELHHVYSNGIEMNCFRTIIGGKHLYYFQTRNADCAITVE